MPILKESNAETETPILKTKQMRFGSVKLHKEIAKMFKLLCKYDFTERGEE